MKKAEPPIFRNQLLARLRIEILHFPKLTLIRDPSRRYVATAFEAAYLADMWIRDGIQQLPHLPVSAKVIWFLSPPLDTLETPGVGRGVVENFS